MSTAPETPAPVNEHETTRERVGAIAAWLVDGKLRPECVATAMQDWQVSRRTAQVYVARAAAKIVRATTFEDPYFALKLSQIQRDRLHQELQELLRKGEFLPLPHWKMKLQTIQTDMKLLDSRDRTAAKIVQMKSPPPPSRETPPPPLRGRAGVGGHPARDLPATGATEAKEPREVLREDPPPPSPEAKTKPRPGPRSNSLTPTLVDAARAALAKACAQPTAHISIVPSQPKGMAGKDMRPMGAPGNIPAPGEHSCALGTKQVVDSAQSGAAASGP